MMEKKIVHIVPGLYKIFDELLVNVIDQVTRLNQNLDDLDNIKYVKNLKISVDSSNFGNFTKI